ncbi:MAG TPA: VPDSG-CTERM sorting domain-containing protein [Verrucomicrobiae bacterium]|nr:VPDSG-CTERM sorting domain-containing protein [Verrucomicrobiae bacterium]
MKMISRPTSVVIIIALSLALIPAAARATAELELISGSSDIIVADGSGQDLSSAAGQVAWIGTINGWTFAITAGDTKPLLGTATSPQLDLGVMANVVGNGNLIVKFSDSGFGPSSGTVNSTFFENGTSTASAKVLVDPANTLFGGSPSTDGTLAGPYSITLVDTFTPGLVSSDHRVSVPDSGATVALLGFGLVGVESLRRRINAKR